jgi:hypothetical protein
MRSRREEGMSLGWLSAGSDEIPCFACELVEGVTFHRVSAAKLSPHWMVGIKSQAVESF